MKERKWREGRDEEMWYIAWRSGLAEEVEEAVKKYFSV